MTCRFFDCLVLAASLLSLGEGLLTPPLFAEPGSRSPTGTLRLPSGLTAHYAYHFNRNALRESRRAGDAIIALTESGNLLRLDLATLKLNREWFGPVPVVCLGRGEEGAVLAGFEDGRLCRVDPATLALIEVARLPGKPRWVEAVADDAGQPAKTRLVTVVEQSAPAERNGQRFQIRTWVVQDLGSGKTYALDFEKPDGPDRGPVAFLIDRKRRLWLGADNGEWGGWCCYVDFQEGKVHSVPGPEIDEETRKKYWLGIYGFTELRDGQIWAYGGMVHMGSDGFIGRVDRGHAEQLFRFDGLSEDKPVAEDRPHMPVTHVIEDPKTGAILVVSFSEIFRTDQKLARWEKLQTLKIGYRRGRPDALGAYPSIRSVFPIEEPGKPLGLLFATRMDGFVRLADGKPTHHPVAPGQLGIAYVDRIENSTEGILALGGRFDAYPWRFRKGTWDEVSFAPPYEPAPKALDGQQNSRKENWDETYVLLDRNGAISTISAVDSTLRTRTVARWRDGKAIVLGREESALDPSDSFLTPDGALWNLSTHVTRELANGDWDSDVVLQRFASGRWGEAARFPLPRARGIGIGDGLRTVNDAGPPWTLLDHRRGQLLRLTHGPNFKDPRLDILALRDEGHPLQIRDATPWTKAELLLATDRGLKVLTLDGDKLTAAPIDIGAHSVTRLCRDGRGRLWLGGEGLAFVEAGGKAPQRLDDLPMMGRVTVDALAADPDHPDGVIAALSRRGVVFVRVSDQ